MGHCNETWCLDNQVPNREQATPPTFNDKTHNGTNEQQRLDNNSYNTYLSVQPFLIGASTVIVIYVVINCLYIHCYAKCKMKKLAERHFPPTIIISDDPTSNSSYQPYTPVVRYNEHGEMIQGGSFVFYQPYEEEWEQSQYNLHASLSSLGRSAKSKSSKKKATLQIPRIFRKKKRTKTSIENTETLDDNRPSPQNTHICLVPVHRSRSMPGTSDKQSP